MLRWKYSRQQKLVQGNFLNFRTLKRPCILAGKQTQGLDNDHELEKMIKYNYCQEKNGNIEIKAFDRYYL